MNTAAFAAATAANEYEGLIRSATRNAKTVKEAIAARAELAARRKTVLDRLAAGDEALADVILAGWRADYNL